MSVAAATMTGVSLDPATAIVLACLRRQAESLAAVCNRLDHAVDAVPRSADGTWRGPASTAYDAGLRQLRRVADTASASTREALEATRAAVASLAAAGS